MMSVKGGVTTSSFPSSFFRTTNTVHSRQEKARFRSAYIPYKTYLEVGKRKRKGKRAYCSSFQPR
jgi:hypothetical protein